MTEDDCRRYLVECRWPDGYRCPRCAHAEPYELSTRELFQCRSCRHQVSVTAGTILHRTRVPLHLWFSAAYLVTTHTPGFSAVQLQRQLGLNRYETAWTMLQKLRRAMIRPERDHISGIVEVDETYVGGVEEQRRGGRQRDSNKSIVIAAVEVRVAAPAASGSPWRGSLRGITGSICRAVGGAGEHVAGGWMARICPTPQDVRLSTHDGG